MAVVSTLDKEVLEARDSRIMPVAFLPILSFPLPVAAYLGLSFG